MAEKAEVEYPRWVYPPDGGPGCIVQTPDERPNGWLDAPVEGLPQSGERIIGQPTFPVPPLPSTFTTQGGAVQGEDETEDDASSRKSKKKS